LYGRGVGACRGARQDVGSAAPTDNQHKQGDAETDQSELNDKEDYFDDSRCHSGFNSWFVRQESSSSVFQCAIG
jgi:hypothetical protein